jgi:transposase
MKEMVTLNKKEQKRVLVLNQVEAKKISCRQASQILEISIRQVKRLIATYRRMGAGGIAHGNKVRQPSNTLPIEVKQKIFDLMRTTYAGCNTQHYTELLEEREGIKVSRSTVRRILLEAGIKSPRKRRAPKHRSRRERYTEEGMLLQIDGSRHDWLEGRGPYLTLVGAIDDATGEVPYALFREQEDAQGYFLLLRQIVATKGIPMALYHDRHSIFERPKEEDESLSEQLEGERQPTQFGRLMEELDIVSIHAMSPQAKGRVERLWSTFQDRLVSELRLAGVKTLDEANQMLWQYLPRHNQRFAVSAVQPGLAFRSLPEGFNPDEVFCFKYQRKVGADNVVRFGKERLQIISGDDRLSYAYTKVEVYEKMDCSLAVYYQGRCLATKSAPPEASVLRARNMPRASTQKKVTTEKASREFKELDNNQRHKPGSDHPWRKSYKAFFD